MYATERQSRIADELERAGRVSVTGLSREFDVTTETIRRDLDALEGAGLLRRVHGGAIRRASAAELHLDDRRRSGREAKRAIARAALDLVPAEAGSIGLDAGSTTGALADLLADRRPEGDAVLDVVTHGVPLIGALQANTALAVHAVGGLVRPTTSAAVGASTVETYSRMRLDVVFLGANGLSAAFGASTPDEREAAVKTAMIRAARRRVLLIDATKFGEEALLTFAALGDLDVVITDRSPEDDLAAALEDAGVDLVVAPPRP